MARGGLPVCPAADFNSVFCSSTAVDAMGGEQTKKGSATWALPYFKACCA
ncbi:asparagine synthetase domain-containing protein 1 [Acetobacter orientalis]|uniref:Asparagine synthetase domain-containing protein 1 n=1 Tax=Acetobacter orientalis TaxID=146474 RepID=A0A2Z5ZLL1_9PROT|nr:asparagine synthetase domain-containing protein 1 [Acetobacter orientalis]